MSPIIIAKRSFSLGMTFAALQFISSSFHALSHISLDHVILATIRDSFRAMSLIALKSPEVKK